MLYRLSMEVVRAELDPFSSTLIRGPLGPRAYSSYLVCCSCFGLCFGWVDLVFLSLFYPGGYWGSANLPCFSAAA